MSLQKYTALLKTIELGSISLAAAEMGYTQPAVSRMIADLESEWDMELLRRSRSGLEVSSACQKLLPVLRAIVEGCEELGLTVSDLHSAHTGCVRVGVFTSVADMWIPDLLKSFREQYPNIEFDLIGFDSYAETEAAIRHGRIDCGFVSLPTTHDLQTHFLHRDCLVAVLPADHPLAGAPAFPAAQLEGAPFIMFRETADFEISRFLGRISYTPSTRYTVSDDHTLLSMVEQGLGIGITHSLIAENPRYRVVCKHFDVEQYRDIGIATAKDARLTTAVRLFIDHVCRSLGENT